MSGLRPEMTGMITASVAPLLAEARVGAEMTSQLLRGERVRVFAVLGEWCDVEADADGYRGWLHQGYAAATSSNGGGAKVAPTVGRSLGCVVSDGGVQLALPFGAALLSTDVVRSGEWVSDTQRPAAFPPDAPAAATSAVHYFAGTPYLWGGVTPWGADCSGMVQRVFEMHGMSLPRDSFAQGAVGRRSAVTPLNAPAGVLLFFSDRGDGRVTHVGVALGEGRMVHLSLLRGGYFVEHFNAEHGVLDAVASQLLLRFRFAVES